MILDVGLIAKNKEMSFLNFLIGFTSLCEKYADMVTEDSTCGTDKLTATLNSYIGKIVDCMFRIA